VLLDGALGDAGLPGDLLVRQAGGDPGDDVALTEGQGIEPPRGREQPATEAPAGEQPAQQRGRSVHE